MIANTTRNQWIAHIIAEKLTACQLNFILYLYNLTVNVQSDTLYIANLSKLGRTMGYNSDSFCREIKNLVKWEVIKRRKRRYSLNFNFISQSDQRECVLNSINMGVYSQLSHKKHTF